jgi:hypothetical protein
LSSGIDRVKGHAGARLTRAFLVILFFLVYLSSYLLLVTVVLRKNAALRSLSSRSIPAFRNVIPGFSYGGFIAPFSVALLALILLLQDKKLSRLNLGRTFESNAGWISAALASLALWYVVPGLASGGHTDFPLAVLTCGYMGWRSDKRTLKQSMLLSIVLGFGIGFVSDLQSQTYFTGIFGGWGLLDGDLLGTIALPLAMLTVQACSRRLGPQTEKSVIWSEPRPHSSSSKVLH